MVKNNVTIMNTIKSKILLENKVLYFDYQIINQFIQRKLITK